MGSMDEIHLNCDNPLDVSGGSGACQFASQSR